MFMVGRFLTIQNVMKVPIYVVFHYKGTYINYIDNERACCLTVFDGREYNLAA